MSEEEYPVKVKWVNNFQFIAKDDQNHSIVLDLPESSGGENLGFTPTKLLLVAVAGCTAMDIVLLMRKSNQDIKGLEVQVTGEQRLEEYPHYFKEITLKYIVKGKSIDEGALKRAIKLSDEKYCSVGATIKGVSKIITSYEIKEI
ncbi:MAG: OsmC family protein [Nitrososphaerales archaeon]